MGTVEQMSEAKMRLARAEATRRYEDFIQQAAAALGPSMVELDKAKADVAKLAAALKEIEEMKPIDGKPADYFRGWNDSRHRMSRIAHNALRGISCK